MLKMCDTLSSGASYRKYLGDNLSHKVCQCSYLTLYDKISLN